MDSSHPLDPLIKNLEAHVALSARDADQIRNLPHTTRRASAGAFLVREGEVPGPCVILRSGFAYRQKITHSGKRQVLSIHLPGEPLDLQHLYLDYGDHNVQTLTAADIVLVPRAAIRDLKRSNATVDWALSVAISIEASIAREWLVSMGQREAHQRLAHLLCEFSVRADYIQLGTTDGYKLPVSQEWLGDALGVTAVHINRMLRLLVAEGLIMHNQKKIRFPDWQAICAFAEFDGQYLHRERQLLP